MDTDHRPLQFMQTQRKLQNDRHQKWSTYLQQFHLNIKYKKGSTNNVQDYLILPPIMVITTVLNSCRHGTSDWPLLYKSNPKFIHTYQTLLEGNQVPKFHLQGVLLCHMYPPLLDTSDMAEQLTPTELNPNYMEQATIDRIWTHRSRTPASKRSSYIKLSKQANSFTRESGSLGTKFNGSFLISWRNST